MRYSIEPREKHEHVAKSMSNKYSQKFDAI